MELKVILDNYDVFWHVEKLFVVSWKNLPLTSFFQNAFKEATKKYGIPGYIGSTDIDRILRVEDELKAIFELKITHDETLKLRYSQDKTLRLISKKIGLPVYYIVKSPLGYHVIKQRDDDYVFLKSRNGFWDCNLNLREYPAYNRVSSFSRLQIFSERRQNDSLPLLQKFRGLSCCRSWEICKRCHNDFPVKEAKKL